MTNPKRVRSSRSTGSVGLHSSKAKGRTIARPLRNANDYRSLYGIKDATRTRNPLQTPIAVILSIVYWVFVAVGMVSPFLEGFDPGSLNMWQVVFTRTWLSFPLLGVVWAFAVNLGDLRDSEVLRHGKLLKIAAIIVLDVLISFALIRIVCLF